MKEERIVDILEAGQRLDAYLANQVAGLSRTRAQKLIEEGAVQINTALCRDKNHRLVAADRVIVTVPDPKPYLIKPEPIFLNVVYEDRDLLVINKPRGMVVHPAPGHLEGTLVNALLHHCGDLSGIGGVARPGIVHRLDKDTTGLLIVAKNDFSHHALAGQLKERCLRREYLALVHGAVAPFSGRINAPIGRHPRHRKRMAVIPGGREAISRYRVLAVLNRFTLLQVSLETGRTHQVRVHMAYLGHPVVGDPLYGSSAAITPPPLSHGQALHARRIAFTHPRSGNLMEFAAPLPRDFREALRYLREQGL
jgi:23S rRNA pseudouridine1911/1915/1917 synthase